MFSSFESSDENHESCWVEIEQQYGDRFFVRKESMGFKCCNQSVTNITIMQKTKNNGTTTSKHKHKPNQGKRDKIVC
jgi:hypothetical protein